MSNVRVNTILDAAGGNTAQINGMTPTAQSLQGFRNRVINGDMRIDQRNNGASVTANDGTFAVDRFRFSMTQSSRGTGQRSTVVPAGFNNSLLFTSTAATSLGAGDQFAIVQPIEGFNIADLGWGTAAAQTVTLSFWVRSSLTGTFGGSLQNQGANRSYPFAYTISAANTFEFKTVTIPGDTTGTWNTDNNGGIRLFIGLGMGSNSSGTAGAWAASNLQSATGAVSVVGTNGATFYITGVQLEAGSVATPFEQIDYGRELMLCQRYFVDLGQGTNAFRAIGFGSTYSTTQGTYVIQVPVPMRVVPALTQAGTMYLQNLGATSISSFAGPYTMGGTIIEGDFTMVAPIAANAIGILRWNNVAGTKTFAYSAEL
jgi:hypothetical protein